MSVVRQVPLSQQIAQFADDRTAQLGLGFPEYVRFLILQDMQKSQQASASQMLSDVHVSYERKIFDKESGDMKDVLTEYKAGEYKRLRTDADIDDFITGLVTDE